MKLSNIIILSLLNMTTLVFGKKNDTFIKKDNMTLPTTLPSTTSTTVIKTHPTTTLIKTQPITTKTEFFDTNFYCGKGIELNNDLSNILCDLPCSSGVKKDCPPDFSCFNVPNHCKNKNNEIIYLPNSSSSFSITSKQINFLIILLILKNLI